MNHTQRASLERAQHAVGSGVDGAPSKEQSSPEAVDAARRQVDMENEET